jgi:cytochrome P450
MSEAAYDFVDEFNRHQAAMAKVADPHARFASLRSQCPVQRIALRDVLGDGVPLAPGMPEFIYSVLSHETVAFVLRDAELFSSSGYARSMGLVMGHTILEMDPPEHGRYRSLIQSAFSKKALDRWERELVRPVVNAHVDRFAPLGKAELVRALTLPFPVSVIAGMIGLDPADHLAFHRMAVELISIAADPMRGMRASQGLRDLFARVLAERRREPREDLMTVLATAKLDDGTQLDDDAIFAFLRLLAPAGAETT